MLGSVCNYLGCIIVFFCVDYSLHILSFIGKVFRYAQGKSYLSLHVQTLRIGMESINTVTSTMIIA